MIFLCFDAATEKIVDVEFPVLNRDASIDVEKFIRAYNEDKSTLETAMAESSMIDGNAVFNAYTNFKSAMSMFKLMNDDELDFLNFKSFSTFMYDRFIKSLKTSLTRI
jgi:NADPH-dependent curcumin reductase CurA